MSPSFLCVSNWYPPALEQFQIGEGNYQEEKEKQILYEHFRDIEFRGENKEEYFRRITSLSPEESENYEKCKFLEKY